ncbi:hypothetical protein [Chryseobacterium shigense]|uniref:Uncharacterized protein n=1 Tax=Chryseobacterium shigense TaxID=297244 RepID=A0A841N580_9FLAO|nr:hypothetical protein [Chryseobacterium shigense]MBB6370273.1 hypothetical protein [Chryseobacterium shigense]
MDWKINYSSQSKWQNVVDIYETILKNEFYDTDYWYSVGSTDVSFKLSLFTKEDWEKLKEDIVNWKSNQIEILSLILTSDKDRFELTDIKSFQSLKSECYSYLLIICNDDLFTDLIDSIDFIKFNNNKDSEILNEIKFRLLKLKDSPLIQNNNSNHFLYTQTRFENFMQLVNDEIEKADDNSSYVQ